jgi:uncharacterized protein
MALLSRLNSDLKDALRSGDTHRAVTLRMLFAAIKNKEIDERKKEIGLAEEEITQVIQKEAKKRNDAAQEFTKGGRDDLAKKEKEELKFLEIYLPKELSDEEIERIIKDGVRELGSPTEKDLGALMKIIMPALKGKASGGRISILAKKILSKPNE